LPLKGESAEDFAKGLSLNENFTQKARVSLCHLLTPSFLLHFEKGEVTALSCGGFDNRINVSLLPSGLLVLILSKEVYQQLGLPHSKVLQRDAKPFLFVVEVQLKKVCAKTDSKLYKRTHWALSRLAPHHLAFNWLVDVVLHNPSLPFLLLLPSCSPLTCFPFLPPASLLLASPSSCFLLLPLLPSYFPFFPPASLLLASPSSCFPFFPLAPFFPSSREYLHVFLTHLLLAEGCRKPKDLWKFIRRRWSWTSRKRKRMWSTCSGKPLS